MRKIVYITRLSTAECLHRLQEHAIPWAPEKGSVFIKIRGNRFRLFALGSPFMHNHFAPYLYGRVEGANAGSRIVGRLKMHPAVRALLSVWFGGWALMGLVALCPNVTVEMGRATFILWVSAMTLVLAALMLFGRWLARGQVARMLEFVRVELEGIPEGSTNGER